MHDWLLAQIWLLSDFYLFSLRHHDIQLPLSLQLNLQLYLNVDAEDKTTEKDQMVRECLDLGCILCSLNNLYNRGPQT